MKFNLKSFLLIFSLLINCLFILLFVLASFSKNSSLHYFYPGDNYITAAAVVNFPSGGEAVFEQITLTLKPDGKAFLQFTVISSQTQGNLLINALYDPDVISVSQTGYGLEITALRKGETLIQTFTNDGIKNLALIIVE